MTANLKTVADVMKANKGKNIAVFYSESDGSIKKGSKALSTDKATTRGLQVRKTEKRMLNGKEILVVSAVRKRGRPIREEPAKKPMSKMKKAKYEIDGQQYIDDDIYDFLDSNMSSEIADNLLDDVYGDFKIGGIVFSASKILKECDPIAYQEFLSQEVDAQAEQFMSDLEYAEVGEMIQAGQFNAKVIAKSKAPKSSLYSDSKIAELVKNIAIAKDESVNVSSVSNNSRGFGVRMGVGKVKPIPDHLKADVYNIDGTITPIHPNDARKRLEN